MNIQYEVPEQHKKYGRLFGYPVCCIEGFIPLGLRSDVYKLKLLFSGFYGTGFIPCEVCIDREYSELVNEITSRRNKDIKPFPLE